MNHVNFTLKLRRSLGDGVAERKLYACRSISMTHDLTDKITVTALGLSGTSENAEFQLGYSKLNGWYDEIIVENAAGKTTERWVAPPNEPAHLRSMLMNNDS
jgi:hypothetical protein